MIDELTIYNLSVKYPNTVELVREVEKMARADAIDEFYNRLQRNKTNINLANNPWNFVELAYREMIGIV